jgi:hypothetical protein
MAHYHVTENEMTNSPYFRMIREAPAPKTLFEAIASDGQVLPPNVKPLSFIVSTSSWDVIHLRVLHVLCLNDLPLSRIFPQKYTVPETLADELALRVRRLLGLSREQVRSGSFDMTEMAYPFYSELSLLIRTNQRTPCPPTKTDALRPIPNTAQFRSVGGVANTILGSPFSDSTTGSTFSNVSSGITAAPSSDRLVNTTEVVTNNMVVAFTTILSNLLYPVKNPTQHT